jgi:hypothetical protein
MIVHGDVTRVFHSEALRIEGCSRLYVEGITLTCGHKLKGAAYQRFLLVTGINDIRLQITCRGIDAYRTPVGIADEYRKRRTYDRGEAQRHNEYARNYSVFIAMKTEFSFVGHRRALLSIILAKKLYTSYAKRVLNLTCCCRMQC